MSLLRSGAGRPFDAAAGGLATTWNPADLSASMGLSGGNLIATAAADIQGARSLSALISNQKVYMEYVPTINADDQQFGFADLSHILTDTLRVDGHSFCARFGGVFNSASSPDDGTSLPTWATGDNVGVAFDSQNLLFWIRVNGGNWNGDIIANQNPATATGGKRVTSLGAYYAALWIQFATEATTAKFSSVSWSFTAPAGFTQLVQ